MKKKIKINIDNLIELASFEVKPEEKKQFEKELDDFLEYARVIESAPCADMKPASHAVEKKAYMRDDVNIAWEKLDKLLENGPALQGTSYLVPPQSKSAAGAAEAEEENSAAPSDAEFEAVIGLEVHAQLKTQSKLFCGCSTRVRT